MRQQKDWVLKVNHSLKQERDNKIQGASIEGKKTKAEMEKMGPTALYEYGKQYGLDLNSTEPKKCAERKGRPKQDCS